MNYLNNRITSALIVLLLVALVSCDSVTGDPDLPIPLDETMSNTGAFLRINSVESAAFDLADPENAAYSINVEYFDGEGSTLLEDVQFYVSYTSFALDPQDRENIEETAEPFLTIPASEFTENEDGLPSATISVPLTDVVSALPDLTMDDIEIEDRFDLRWDVNLTDGRTFSASEAAPAIGGGFYNSPYTAQVFTVQALDEDQFTGTYSFTQQAPGPIAGLGLPYLFGETFEAELSVDPDNTLNGRVFSAEPYPAFGGLAPVEVPIALGQTATVSAANVGTGLTCGAGLAFGTATQDLVLIDVEDDSQFTLVINDNVNADCGVPPSTIVLEATKL